MEGDLFWTLFHEGVAKGFRMCGGRGLDLCLPCVGWYLESRCAVKIFGTVLGRMDESVCGSRVSAFRRSIGLAFAGSGLEVLNVAAPLGFALEALASKLCFGDRSQL